MWQADKLADLKEVLNGVIEVFYHCLFWGVIGFVAPLGVHNLTVHVICGFAGMAVTGLLIALVTVHKLRHSAQEASQSNPSGGSN